MEKIAEYLSALNPIAVITATLVVFIVGVLWRVLLFGRAWTRLSGIHPGDIRASEAQLALIMEFLTSLITACLLGIIAAHRQEGHGLIFMAIGFIWLFLMLDHFHGSIVRREPFALFLLHTGRRLAAMMAGGLVFHFWSYV